jgi:hypothetical protein
MRILGAFLALALITGCTPADPAAEALATARARWSELATDDYRFSVARDCYCIETWRGPFEVRVVDGVASVTRDGAPVAAELLDGLPTDAAALFAFAAERTGQAAFRAEYDPETGLPLSVWSDPIPEAADDELGISVELLEVSRP